MFVSFFINSIKSVASFYSFLVNLIQVAINIFPALPTVISVAFYSVLSFGVLKLIVGRVNS